MDYRKYRWFLTNSGKLVYGGKSAEQNEAVVNNLINIDENIIVMHTKIPGRPFAVIDSPIKKINESDLHEAAIWCACFSRAWRTGLKKTIVDIFTSKQISKNKGMKTGTFAVAGNIEKKVVELKLYLTKQNGILRTVPEKTLKNKNKELCIAPGKIEKERFAEMISEKLNIKKEEVLNALPTGGFKLCN